MSWRKTTIGEHCTVTSSKRFHAAERTTSGIPFYCSKELIQMVNGEAVTECDYIREDLYEDVKRQFGVPEVGDLLITSRGTYGVPYVYKESDKFYFADGNLTWLKDFDDELNAEYLYYWIKSYEGQKKIDAIAKGTAQKAVPIATLKLIEFSIPDIKTQGKIVDILKAYDMFIENNQKQIKLLEEAAQRLYKEWFVDLRFPNYEECNIVNGIPEGWYFGRLEEIIVYHDMQRKPLSSVQRDAMKGQYRYFGAAGVLDFVNNYLFDGTYLLLGEDGTVITKDGRPVLQYVTGQFWVNNHAHVLTGKAPYTTEYIYMMFSLMGISDVVTGVAQPKISQGRLNAKKVLIPDKNVVLQYQSFAKPYFDRVLLIEKQNEFLKESRDRLLPELMSGKLEV